MSSILFGCLFLLGLFNEKLLRFAEIEVVLEVLVVLPLLLPCFSKMIRGVAGVIVRRNVELHANRIAASRDLAPLIFACVAEMAAFAQEQVDVSRGRNERQAEEGISECAPCQCRLCRASPATLRDSR